MRRKDDDGFTLLELIATVAVIGVLLTIAIPFLAGSQAKASDATALSRARLAVEASRSYRLSEGRIADEAVDLSTIEPALVLTPTMDTATLNAGQVFLSVQPTGDLLFAAGSARSRTCFWAKDTANAGTWYAVADCTTTIDALTFSRSW